MTVLGLMYLAVSNTSLVSRARFLDYALVYLDTVPWTILEDSAPLSVLLAQQSGPRVQLTEPGIPTQPVLEIPERHKTAVTRVQDPMAHPEIEPPRLAAAEAATAGAEVAATAVEEVGPALGMAGATRETAVAITEEPIPVEMETVAKETMATTTTRVPTVPRLATTLPRHATTSKQARETVTAIVGLATVAVDLAKAETAGDVPVKCWRPALTCVQVSLPVCSPPVWLVVPEGVQQENRDTSPTTFFASIYVVIS